MKPESAKALAWTAAILVVLASMILSPSGAFALFVLAAVFAAIPSIFASKRPRIISIALLAISIALAVNFYPAFTREREAYAQRAKERAVAPQVVTPAEQTAPKK
jgi:membrane protein implicated in regulation of membrane protease activity